MRRPNILILYTDQQRHDALGCNGNAHIHTPNLDQLAAEGLNADHYFVNHPVCMPSRVSFLTGRYPSSLGIYKNGTEVPHHWLTLPRILRQYGYRSANIGKLHFLNHANRDHRRVHPDYGFDHLEISDEPGCYDDAHRAFVRATAPDQLDKISYGLPPAAQTWQDMLGGPDIRHPQRKVLAARASACRDDVTHTAFVATRTIDFIRDQQRSGQPFMAIAGFYSPHDPWIAPQRFLDLYDADALPLPAMPEHRRDKRPAHLPAETDVRSIIQGYYAMVSEVDHHVGRILDALEDTGEADNTLVLFTSDHGEWLGEHWRFGKGYPGHDAVSRVPFIARWPGRIEQPGRTCRDIVEAVDVAPMLLEAAGIPIEPSLQGRSLLPTLTAAAPHPRDSALIEFHDARCLRTVSHLYVAHNDGREFLYDQTTPLGPYHDLSRQAEFAETLAHCRRRLLARMIEAAPQRDRQWTY